MTKYYQGERIFSWQPPLAAPSSDPDALEGPKTITMEDINRAFKELDCRTEGAVIDPELENQSGRVEPSTVYPFDELQHIDDGITPRVDNKINVHGRQESEVAGSSSWDINVLLVSKGITNV